MNPLPTIRRRRFRRQCQRLGLKPANKLDRLPPRDPQVDLKISRELSGNWLPDHRQGAGING